MRFGIMDIQIDELIPRGVSPQEMVAHIAGFDHGELVRGLAAQGFNLIELSGDLAFFLPQTLTPLMIQKLAAVKEELGLTYTAHIPLWSMEPATPLAPVRQGAVQAVVDFCQIIRPLEPEIYVFHATGPMAADFYHRDLPQVAKSFLMRLFQSKARESLAAILARTGLPGRALAIETVEFPFDLTLELAEELDLSICLDIGHVLIGYSGQVDLFDVLEACLPRLGEVHLHDGPWQGPGGEIRHGEDHVALGLGDLDAGRFLDRLVEADYAGPVIFELTVAEALASLDEIRSLRPDLVA